MPTYRAQVVLPFFTNLPTDVITNTFHVEPTSGQTIEDAADELTPEIAEFYNSIYSAGPQPPAYFADTGQHVNWYDLSQPVPRVPVRRDFTLTEPPASTPIPTEVACVLSFHGAPVPGLSQASRRGRVYLGGIDANWLDVGAAGTFPRFSAGTLNRVGTAARFLLNGIQGLSYLWVVYSQKLQTGTRVIGGWIDEAPDTQRRRGVLSQQRVLWDETP